MPRKPPRVTIPLTLYNDPGRIIQRHVGREIARGKQTSDIVKHALMQRSDPFGQAPSSRTFTAPGVIVTEITYDPAEIGDFTEKEVLTALRKAGQR